MRIALMNGGGDCPGLNAVTRAVVKRAVAGGHEVLGIANSFRGLFEPGGVRPLTLDAISGILPRGGTILGTSNRADPFRFVVNEGGRLVEKDRSREALARLEALGVEGLVLAGGDGSLTIARRLMELGLRVVGVPKTIDNDLSGTDQTFGFDTARAIATDAVDKLHSTAEAHQRVMILEVMGRNSGFIALESGLAGGADVIVIPEIPYRIDPIIEAIRRRHARGRTFSIVVVAEGARPVGGAQAVQLAAGAVPGRLESKLGGAGYVLADALCARIEDEVRVTVLGHLQRGGSPTPFDRLLASRLGAHAADLAFAGRWGRVAVLRCRDVVDVALDTEATRTRLVDPNGEIANLARGLGVCLGE